ncbi:MAG: Crp/Fnr family transcriptional regulator [Thermodesulfobacterium sp.]|nr:Crp/Fnr family transcriptional regulator [Thermodesulfobacterium sp.]
MNKSFDVLSTLKKSSLFQNAPQNILTELAELATVLKFDKNQEIFGEGEKALGFFLVLDGMVKIYKLSPKGKEQIIHILGPGDVFAEIVLGGAETYPVYAQTLSKVKLAFFEKQKFLNLVQRKPEIALNLLALFAGKLKTLVKQIENLTLKGAGERLLSYLWDLSKEGKQSIFTLNISKSQIALLLGITPETLSRLIQKFKDEEILEIKGKKVKLINPEKIKNFISS